MFLLIGATGGTLWLVYETRKEQKAIGDLLRDHTPDKIDSLAPFPEELRMQLGLTILLLFVLISAFFVMLLILRGYLNSQKSLRNLARQAADILESMEHGVITGDENGRILMMNREAQRILKSTFPEQDTTFEDLKNRIHLRLGTLAQNVLSQRKPIENQSFEFLADSPVYLLVDGHLLRDEEGAVHGTVLHLRDVTERELIRTQMQRMEGYLGLGPVAAGLQHEIKNPLSALSLHVQLLAEKLASETDSEIREHLGVLRAELERIGGVLECFRDYANADVLNLARADLSEVISHSVKLIAPQAAAKDVTVRFKDCLESIPAMVDTERIQQILLNLLLNALEAMNSPGEIRVALSLTDDRVEIQVRDQGSGISKAALQHIFDPYFTTKAQGMGMGLAVCRKIARLHDGDLEFETGADGTVFQLTIARNSHGKL
jgi:two-component system, NtrC family, sensor histidine kinase HydH